MTVGSLRSAAAGSAAGSAAFRCCSRASNYSSVLMNRADRRRLARKIQRVANGTDTFTRTERHQFRALMVDVADPMPLHVRDQADAALTHINAGMRGIMTRDDVTPCQTRSPLLTNRIDNVISAFPPAPPATADTSPPPHHNPSPSTCGTNRRTSGADAASHSTSASRRSTTTNVTCAASTPQATASDRPSPMSAPSPSRMAPAAPATTSSSRPQHDQT